MPPGHIICISAADERTTRWWNPAWAPPGAGPGDPTQAVEQVDHLLQRSVSKMMVADGPVAVLLSGGLDSSSILHHCSKTKQMPATFTVSLADDLADETALAARVAKVMGAPHEIVRIDHRDLIDNLEHCTRLMGQPLPSAAGVLQYLLFRQLRSTARAVLSGDGGDEIFGGRAMRQVAQRLRYNRLLGYLPSPLEELGRQTARRSGKPDLAVSQSHFGRDRNIGGSSVFHSRERVTILCDPAMARPGIRRTTLEPFYQEIDSDPINAILHVWQRGWLSEDSLARSDRMAAHVGLEIRFPMLDQDLTRFAASLPGPVKVQRKRLGYVTKWPLREAMQSRLPRSLLHRPKRSLPTPLDDWLRAAGQEFLRDTVDQLVHTSSPIFVPDAIQKLSQEHIAGHRNHGLKLWTVCLLQIWQRLFLS